MFDDTYSNPIFTTELISEIQLTSQEMEITFEEAQDIVIDNQIKDIDDDLPF